MNAKMFVESVHQLTPTRENLKNEAPDFVDSYLMNFAIFPYEEKIEIKEKDAIIDLIYNYDVSNLLIQIFSFSSKNDVWENDKHIFFGWREAFPLGISKETDEIVELDWSSPDFVVSYVAKNQQLFLDTLIEIEKINQKRMFGTIDNIQRKELLQNMGKIAGGKKYNDSYKDL